MATLFYKMKLFQFGERFKISFTDTLLGQTTGQQRHVFKSSYVRLVNDATCAIASGSSQHKSNHIRSPVKAVPAYACCAICAPRIDLGRIASGILIYLHNYIFST